MPISPSPGTLAHLAQMLRQRLTVTMVGQQTYRAGPAAQDEIVITNRLILVVKGELNYLMEGRTQRWEAGAQFFIPAWVRRVSTVSKRAPCEIRWCEFDDDGLDSSAFGYFWRVPRMEAFRQEQLRHMEMMALWREVGAHGREADRLRLEGELKAMLARFWTEAAPLGTERGRMRAKSEPPVHAQVKTALRWLRDHLQEPDALESLYRNTPVTRNYFRRHFKAALQCTPQEYLQRLRMRRARYLVHQTNLLQKQIAMEVGYPDALYFTKMYRKFWGRAPRAERKVW